MSTIPPVITLDQYDKLMREIWELKQRQAGIEKTIYTAVQVDELFSRLSEIEKALNIQPDK